MTPTNNNDELKLSVIFELTDYTTLSNIVYVDFHGQEEGEDPRFDKFCSRQKDAEDKLYKAIHRYAQKMAKEEYKKGFSDGQDSLLRSGQSVPVLFTEKEVQKMVLKELKGLPTDIIGGDKIVYVTDIADRITTIEREMEE